jgi:hypothetical protein
MAMVAAKAVTATSQFFDDVHAALVRIADPILLSVGSNAVLQV